MKSKTKAGYVAAPPPTVTVKVFDDRPELPTRMRHVATFQRVSADWRARDIIEYFGIAEHLHVVRCGEGADQIIQQGRR